MNKRISNYKFILLILVTVYFTTFISYTLIRHWSFGTQAYDTGIYAQSLWTTAHREGFFYNTPEAQGLGWELPSSSHFGVHFQPILLILVPVYYFIPYPEVLFIFETIAIGLAVFPLYDLSRIIIKSEKKALVISILYLVNPAIHGINRYDFHPVAFSLPFIFMIMKYWEIQEYHKAFLVSLFVLAVKEDAGLILISIGAFYVLKKFKKKSFGSLKKFLRLIKSEIYLIVLGIEWILISTIIIIPYFARHWYSYTFYGFRIYFPSLSVWMFLINILSWGGLPLLKPRLFVATLPLWAELIFSPMYGMVKIGYHYPYMLVPMLALTSTYAIKEIDYRKAKMILGIGVVSFLLFSPIVNLSNSPAVAGTRYLTLMRNYIENKSFYDNLKETLKEYDKFEGKIVVQDNVFPHLANNRDVYLLRGSNIRDANIILICPRFRDLYSRYYIPRLTNVSNVLNICSS